jgi:hypothetical protein
MFKKILTATGLIAVVGLLIFGAVNRTMAMDNGTGSRTEGSGSAEIHGNGNNSSGQHGNGEAAGESISFDLPTSGSLDADEQNALITMREEEKLAHDVYVTLYTKWGLPIFQNISQSEQTHTDSVKALIDRYNLSDPALNAIGVFTNPDLQALFNSLVERGNQSLSEALKVGAAIEEIDILDLEKYLSQTNNADIQKVFGDLKNGSYNHLNAFTSTLNRQTGETYQPQYLSMEAYQAILETRTGGNGNAGSGGGGRNGRP